MYVYKKHAIEFEKWEDIEDKPFPSEIIKKDVNK